MISRIAFAVLLSFPALSHAQLVPATYPYSGVKATASLSGIVRDGPRYAGPRYEAAGMKAPPVVETFSPVKSPKGPANLIRRVQSPFVLTNADINIPDVQDAVFFAENRVVRVRLHLKVAGEPMSKAWIKQLQRYFDFLDRDGDGYLNAFEADFIFSNRSLQQMLQNGQAVINPTEAGRALSDIDRDGDGKISFDEFVAYYAPATSRLMQVQPNVNRDTFAESLTDELFNLLDRDKDGKLSKFELAEMEKLLPLLDQNEDECLTALEIVPNLVSRPRAPIKLDARPTGTLQFFTPGTIPDAIIEQIISRYDKDKDLRLSKVESGFDDATFAKLDKNGDGLLSITELLAWKDLPPDLEIELTFGPKQSECSLKLLPGPDGKPSPRAGNVKMSDAGKAYIRVGQQQIDLGAVGSQNFVVRNAPLFTFEMADPTNQGYINESDIAGPRYQFLRVLFDLVDRDGDGKMTRKEFTDYFELQQSFTNLPLAVTHLTQAPSLFSLIDFNGDGRLTVREMRNSWSRLKDLEPGGGEVITRAALKPLATIRFGRASQVFQPIGGTNLNPNIQPLSRGPLWFRKMDRNADGDVSRSEFPGTQADFDKLDTDQDGLISVEEAEAADKLFRSEKK